MPPYAIDLPVHRPDVYRNLLLEECEVPVKFRGEVVSTAKLSESGQLRMELAADLFHLVHSGTAKFCFFREEAQPLDGQPGRNCRLFEIAIESDVYAAG